MKKITLLALLFFVLSCSKDDDKNNASVSISPPSWIQGTWLHEDGSLGFRFTSNDFIILANTTETSHKEQLELAGGSADEEFDEDSYSITLKYQGGTSISYSFKKVSDTEIEHKTLIFIKQ